MGLHPYCITPAGFVPRDVQGVGDASVRAFAARGLAAWASEHTDPPAASVEAVRAHDAVIRRAMGPEVTPVPLRFGQWAASEAVLRERLEEHAERWGRLLGEFAGAAEMGLRFEPAVAAAAAKSPRPATGREYMAQLAARVHDRDAAERERTALLERVADVVGDVAFRTASGAPAEDPHALWVAHLVRLGGIDEYRNLADRIAHQETGYRVAVTGPWPPYSFVS